MEEKLDSFHMYSIVCNNFNFNLNLKAFYNWSYFTQLLTYCFVLSERSELLIAMGEFGSWGHCGWDVWRCSLVGLEQDLALICSTWRKLLMVNICRITFITPEKTVSGTIGIQKVERSAMKNCQGQTCLDVS